MGFAFSREVGHLIICLLSLANLLAKEIFGLNFVKYIGKFWLMALHIPSAFVPSRPEFNKHKPSIDDNKAVSQQEETFSIIATPTLSENVRRSGRNKKSE